MLTKNSLLILFILSLWSCADRVTVINSLETEIENETINFKYNKFGDALNEARELKKPLLIYFTSDGCGWCLKMENEVFIDTTLQKFINKNFICSKVHLKRLPGAMKSIDYEKMNRSRLDFMDLYDINQAFPTFAIINYNTELIKQESKFMNIQELIEFGKAALLPLNNE